MKQEKCKINNGKTHTTSLLMMFNIENYKKYWEFCIAIPLLCLSLQMEYWPPKEEIMESYET